MIAGQPAPAPHLARPSGCVAIRIALVTVPRVSRSSEHFPDVLGVEPEEGLAVHGRHLPPKVDVRLVALHSPGRSMVALHRDWKRPARSGDTW